MDYAKLTAQARQAAEELLQAAHLETGDIFVVGCSSSEIMGGRIGKDSSMEAAAAVLAGVLPPLQEQGVYLAAQCCEHLNRSIVIEREAAKANGYQIVSAIPQPHAGGSWATNCWQRFNDPVLVEEVRAAAARLGLVQDILVEINIGEEASKSGVDADSLFPLLEAAAARERIRLRGLMAIPPADADDTETRRFFAQMRELLARADARHYDRAQMDILSMGMSHDYAAAIAEGATIVRVGTAIYGARDYSKKA